MSQVLRIHNGQRFDVTQCPVVSMDAFRLELLGQIEDGAHLAALFVRPANPTLLSAVLAIPEAGNLGILATEVAGALA